MPPWRNGDAGDLKSLGLSVLWVRIPPVAPFLKNIGVQMYRRIELIYEHFSKKENKFWSEKGGIFSAMPHINDDLSEHLKSLEIFDSWASQGKITGWCGNIPKNAKFFFTEKGWKDVGRHVVSACLKTRTKFRILKVKENSVNVVWANDYELAAQPKKGKDLERKSRV